MSFEKVKTMTECEYALYVAECILDGAANEWLAENAANPESVENYALNALDRGLDDEVSKLIHDRITAYCIAQPSSLDEYYYIVEYPIIKHFGDI